MGQDMAIATAFFIRPRLHIWSIDNGYLWLKKKEKLDRGGGEVDVPLILMPSRKCGGRFPVISTAETIE